MKFEKIGIGGTFDRLHSGHKLILDIAAFYCQLVHIGLITKDYLDHNRKILGEIIETFEVRSKALIDYLSWRNCSVLISEITKRGEDRELAVTSNIHALIVSPETYSGALLINKKRISVGKQPLNLIILPFVLQNDNTVISSTKIRQSTVKMQEKKD